MKLYTDGMLFAHGSGVVRAFDPPWYRLDRWLVWYGHRLRARAVLVLPSWLVRRFYRGRTTLATGIVSLTLASGERVDVRVIEEPRAKVYTSP